jgi:hypothetical protein
MPAAQYSTGERDRQTERQTDRGEEEAKTVTSRALFERDSAPTIVATEK